ncbi:MAG: hypothetical protein H0V56_05055 [Chthoniobacterales bacterium]|nr:hypothetical protein [Chthoniobacterales bacterium]
MPGETGDCPGVVRRGVELHPMAAKIDARVGIGHVHRKELYWDRPRESWPFSENGELAMFTRPLDLDGLLAVP